MTHPALLSNDPTRRYNVAIPAEKPGGAPSYPLRNLVGAWRALTIVPWLQETSLEDVVCAWQSAQKK